MKINELNEKDKERFEEETRAVAASMGIESRFGIIRNSKNDRHSGLKNVVGLCYDCTRLEYCKTEYGNIFANCEYFNMRITGRDRIKECSHYSRRGQMTLDMAFSLGRLIDIEGRKAGF